MSAKLVLDMAAMQEDFFSDSALIGIVSALPVYRFSWLLNRKFGLRFEREADLDVIVQTGKGKQYYFPVYQYCLPLNGYKHLLYKLKSDKETLLPEVKQLDYMWMIQSSTADNEAYEIIQHLRNINDIQLAQILSHDRLKNLSSLLV
jgi:hypothetical protein